MEKDTENQACPTLAGEVKQEVKAHLFHNVGFLRIDYFTLFWIFVAGCVFGLVVETVFHAIVYGGYESRAGLVWGPFSPIYGTGAVMLTIVAARFSDLSTPAMFLVSALIGSAVEMATGWLMEILFGAVAWDYSHLPGSFGRSLNPGFTLLWGALGLATASRREWIGKARPFGSSAQLARRSWPSTSPSPSRCSRARAPGQTTSLPPTRSNGASTSAFPLPGFRNDSRI